MPILICRRVIYHSPGDEAMFFTWLDRISAIRPYEGKGEDVLLHVSSRVSAAAYRELAALFRRYHIDQDQLNQINQKERDKRDQCKLHRSRQSYLEFGRSCLNLIQ